MYIITQSLCCTPERTQPCKSAIPQFLKINPSGQFMASLIARLVKNLRAMQETLVRFLDPADPLEQIGYPLQYSQASLVAQLVKNLPAMQEVWVRSLGWEDPLEKGKATHSSLLAWRIPWTVYHGVTKSQTRLSDFHFQRRPEPRSQKPVVLQRHLLKYRHQRGSKELM